MKTETLGQRIAYARVMTGVRLDGKYSMKQMAMAMAAVMPDRRDPYSVNTICSWEQGKTEPPINALAAIGKVTQVRLEWLAFGFGEPHEHTHRMQATA